MFTNLNEYKPSQMCFKACPPGEYCLCRNEINNKIYKIKNMTELEKTQEELINLLYNSVIDLSMMSKIELGDDVIKKLNELKNKINQLK